MYDDICGLRKQGKRGICTSVHLLVMVIIPRPRTACGRDTVVVVLVSVCVCINLLSFAL